MDVRTVEKRKKHGWVGYFFLDHVDDELCCPPSQDAIVVNEGLGWDPLLKI